MGMLGSCHYRLAARKFLLDLFDLELDNSVLEYLDGRVAQAQQNRWSINIKAVNTEVKSNEDEEMLPREELRPILTVKGFLV